MRKVSAVAALQHVLVVQPGSSVRRPLPQIHPASNIESAALRRGAKEATGARRRHGRSLAAGSALSCFSQALFWWGLLIITRV